MIGIKFERKGEWGKREEGGKRVVEIEIDRNRDGDWEGRWRDRYGSIGERELTWQWGGGMREKIKWTRNWAAQPLRSINTQTTSLLPSQLLLKAKAKEDTWASKRQVEDCLHVKSSISNHHLLTWNNRANLRTPTGQHVKFTDSNTQNWLQQARKTETKWLLCSKELEWP